MSMISTKVVTGQIRFSYCHVWEPAGLEGNAKKFSAAILIPKNDINTLNAINAAVSAAIEAGKSKLAGPGGAVNMAMLKMPLRDGDVERPEDPNYNGMYFLNASSNQRPGIVDADVNPILDQSQFYSGCYGRAAINFYAFASSGNKGIAAGLNNVQKTAEGDQLAGGSTAAEDFGAPTGQPQYNTAPAPVGTPQYAPPQQQPQYVAPTAQPQYVPQSQAPQQQQYAPPQQQQYIPPVNNDPLG